jgi:small subunit ribosomal protein S6
MVKKYEVVLILDPQVGDTQLESAVEKYKAQLEAAGAEVINVDTWGLRKLAYTSMALRQRQQAFYVMYQIEAGGDILLPYEAALRLDEAVLRHLVISVEGEFLRIPQLAPENIFIYNPPARPHDRRGPRRDRDDRRDGPPPGAGRPEGASNGEATEAAPAPAPAVAVSDNGSAADGADSAE